MHTDRVSFLRGFTLVELMVAVAIILLMVSILVPSFMEARQTSRDRERIGDLAELEFAINAYFESTGEYPAYSGMAIGRGDEIDAALATFIEPVAADPRNNEEEYRYYYDHDHRCDGQRYIVLAAQTMERSSSANVADVCPGSALSGSDAYMIIIAGPIIDNDGTFSIPTLGDGWWNDPNNQL